MMMCGQMTLSILWPAETEKYTSEALELQEQWVMPDDLHEQQSSDNRHTQMFHCHVIATSFIHTWGGLNTVASYR